MLRILRALPATLCFGAFAASVVIAAVYGWASYGVEQEVANASASDSQELTEGLKAGIAHTSESAQRLTQVILLIGAALWGLILGKKGEKRIVLGNRVTCTMTIVSNAVVLVYLYSFHVLDTSIARILFTSAKVRGKEVVVHVDNMRLADLVSYQRGLFIAATVALGSTLIYAHVVRKESSNA